MNDNLPGQPETPKVYQNSYELPIEESIHSQFIDFIDVDVRKMDRIANVTKLCLATEMADFVLTNSINNPVGRLATILLVSTSFIYARTIHRAKYHLRKY